MLEDWTAVAWQNQSNMHTVQSRVDVQPCGSRQCDALLSLAQLSLVCLVCSSMHVSQQLWHALAVNNHMSLRLIFCKMDTKLVSSMALQVTMH